MKGLMQTEGAREPAKLQTPHNGLLSACRDGAAFKVTEASSLKDQVLTNVKRGGSFFTCISTSTLTPDLQQV